MAPRVPPWGVTGDGRLYGAHAIVPNALTAGIDDLDGVPFGPYTDWVVVGS